VLVPTDPDWWPADKHRKWEFGFKGCNPYKVWRLKGLNSVGGDSGGATGLSVEGKEAMGG
jgi:hypothetical protein